MSRVMLHGVLMMPPNSWDSNLLDVKQRHNRYIEASGLIARQDYLLEETKILLKEVLKGSGKTDKEGDLTEELYAKARTLLQQIESDKSFIRS